MTSRTQPPFDPPLDITAGMTDEEMTYLFRLAVEQSIEEKKAKGLPIAYYDTETRKAYLQYPDGRREYEI